MHKTMTILVAILVTGCVTPQKYSKERVTQSYNYKDSVKPQAVYSCIQNELFSQGYRLEYGKLNNKFGVNRFDVMHKSETVASLEIYTGASSISSQAFVKNELTRRDLDEVQSFCVKHTGHHSSMTGAIIEGLLEGLN